MANGDPRLGTNGDQQRLASLAENLRGVQQGINPAALTPAPGGDLGAHMADVVQQLREIARYTVEYADNLQKGLLTYERHVQQMLGKVGK